MNEIITKEMLDLGIVTDEICEKVEEALSAKQWFETFKYEVQKVCEKYGFKKWETDYWSLVYVEEHDSPKVDTKRMKETYFDIVDAETGEVINVNAYEYFVRNNKVKAHMTFKEKK